MPDTDKPLNSNVFLNAAYGFLELSLALNHIYFACVKFEFKFTFSFAFSFAIIFITLPLLYSAIIHLILSNYHIIYHIKSYKIISNYIK